MSDDVRNSGPGNGSARGPAGTGDMETATTPGGNTAACLRK